MRHRVSAVGLLSGAAVLRARPSGAVLYAPRFARALTTPPSSSSTTNLSSPVPVPDADAANPPATTRPPPLDLPPPRRPGDPAGPSAAAHLLATGKAYLAFYKTGLRHLYANARLVRGLPATDATRAHALLRQRWRHDARRLPLFALLLLVCGELTPLAVLLVPRMVPYPCRIPQQVDALLEAEERRRARAFDLRLDRTQHIARSLGLVVPLWDRLPWHPPHAARATARRLRALAADDALLRRAGGAPALADAELRLACADRGLDTRGVGDGELRARLAAWLERTAGADSDEELHRRMEALLTTRPDDWPA